jgi:hypothetical protein
VKDLNKKTMGLLLGGLLILIAIILAAVHFIYKIYYESDVKWYFRGLIGVIGLIGIVVAAWAYTKKQAQAIAT